MSAQQERDAIIANLQKSLAASQQRVLTLEASVAALTPVKAASEAQLAVERQQRAAEKEGLLAQLGDSRRALSREQERCLQLEEALVKGSSSRGEGAAPQASDAPALATTSPAEELSPIEPRPRAALRSSSSTPTSPGDGISTGAAQTAPAPAPSSEEPTPQPTPAATPAPTPVTSRAPSPTPRDGSSNAAGQAASMSTLSSVLTTLAFGMSTSSGTPATGEAAAPEGEARTSTSSGGLLDYVWEATGLSPKTGEGSPAGAAAPDGGLVAKLRTSC